MTHARYVASDRCDTPLPWTPDQDELLRDLWMQAAPQLSSEEIAQKMGKTKYAVIGRSHRLNLPKRESPIKYAAEIDVERYAIAPNTPPMPVGHPVSWGAISKTPFPQKMQFC